MRKFVILLAAAGCQPAAPPADGPLDYAGWPAVGTPIAVDPAVFTFCEGPRPGTNDPRDTAVHGPHVATTLKFFANPAGLDAVTAGATPVPVGTTMLKEKWWQPGKEPAELLGYAAMVKREPGYDPANGDWEYVYAETTGERSLTRGKLAGCADCHARAKGTDYLFRTYLKR